MIKRLAQSFGLRLLCFLANLYVSISCAVTAVLHLIHGNPDALLWLMAGALWLKVFTEVPK